MMTSERKDKSIHRNSCLLKPHGVLPHHAMCDIDAPLHGGLALHGRRVLELVNKYVPRCATYGSALKPVSMTYGIETKKKKTNEDTHRTRGMLKNTFIGTFYSGKEDLFLKAHEAGECFQDETDGM